jgi:ribonuclease HI
VRAKLRCDYAVEWAIIARICSERTETTRVEWVKGHSKDRWNEAADETAKEAQSVVGKAWEVNAKEQDDLRYTAMMAGRLLHSRSTPERP